MLKNRRKLAAVAYEKACKEQANLPSKKKIKKQERQIVTQRYQSLPSIDRGGTLAWAMLPKRKK